MQHPNKHTCNVHLKKQMKHCEQMLATYVYKPLQHMQHPGILLQHPYATLATYTSETSGTYVWNTRFSTQHGAGGAAN
jgi:hypothetical protein